MNELTLDGKTYVSSRRAAEITGYAKDYVGQLCREGRVEARLVGRNWYILESAIREHRFGTDKGEDTVAAGSRNFASTAWEAPRYMPETAPTIPSLSERSLINKLSDSTESLNSASSEATSPLRSTLLTDMQSAWQEWYERREGTQSGQEIASEAVPSETIEEAPQEETALFEEQHLEPSPETTLDLTRAYVNAYEEEGSSSSINEAEYIEEPPAEEEGIIIEEKIRAKIGSVGVGMSSMLVRSLFVAATLLVVAVTIVGSGLLEEFGAGNSITRSSEIRFLAGVSSYNH